MAAPENSAPRALSTRANVAWNTIGCLFYQGCLWLTTIFVVMLSGGYDDAGVLALAMAVGNIFSPIALYKMRTFQVSDLEGTYHQGTYCAARFATLGLGFVICIPYALLTVQGAGTVAAVLAFLLFKADEAFADFLYGIDQRAMRMDYIGRSQMLRGVLSLVAFCTMLGAFGSLIGAILGMFVVCALVTLFYDLPRARRFETFRPRVSRAIGKLLLLCLPAVIAAVCNSAVVSVARQFLGGMMGDEVLGIYASIATPAVLAQAAVGYLYSPMIGGLSEQWRNGSRKDLLRFMGKMALLVVGALFICCLVLLVVWPLLAPSLFGEGVVSALWIFPWVLACTACIAVAWLLTDMLIVFRKTIAALAANAAALVVSMIASPTLISSAGMNGVNLAILAAYGTAILIAFVLLLYSVLKDS